MSRVALWENGVKLAFHYYKVVDGKRATLLASCDHTCVMASASAAGAIETVPLPPKLMRALMK